MCKDFVSYAQRKEGFGDLSIVRAYERYKADTPAVSRIRIWSLDKHLMSYDEKLTMNYRRNR